VIDRLRGEPLVVVAGDSGAGKSSLCRAAVLPRVGDGALGPGVWHAATLVPGAHPRRALAAALLPWVDDLADPEAAAARLRQRLGRGAGLLLLLDQMEEMVTLAPAERAAEAAEALAVILDRVPQLRLLATARSDALGRLAALPGLGERISRGLFFLGPLRPAGVREAIVGPARARGVRFAAEAMVDTLAAAALAPGGLPALSFALAELWEKREGDTIPEAALEALGGVGGALGRHADAALGRLGARREEAKRALLALVTAEGARARRSAAELRALAGPEVIDALIRERLITARREEGSDEGAYELAHEALVDGWPTLRGWLDGDGVRRAVLARVEAAAAEWERLDRSRHALWDPARLAEAAVLARASLAPRERAFLDASRRLARRRRALRFAAYAALPAGVAGIWAGVQLAAHLEHARNIAGLLAQADAARAVAAAHADLAAAARRRALALFDAADPAAESAWPAVVALDEEAAGDADRVIRFRERVFLLDPTRADLRAALAAAFADRAALAERAFRRAERDALLERAAAYDVDFPAPPPPRLVIAVSPPGAEATIAAYRDHSGHLHLDRPRPLDPDRELTTPPGSYLVTVTAPGRPALLAPLLLHAGERRREQLTVPAAVPEGFVHVPAGRFVTGSADPEEIRRWLFAAPAHEVESGAFLISRTEVTFADWMAFLRALPPEARAARLPRVVDHFQVTDRASEVALTEAPDGTFVLTLQPTRGQRHVLREGEHLRYPGRSVRAEQDWRAFPVTGISWEDASAYLAWLSSSGRAPGARFCAEREWERAARGADGRIFPHGDTLAPEDAAFDETHGRSPLAFGPDEVGSHPASDSPFGVADLAGNAWELTRGEAGGQTLRGGSWYQSARTARSDNRVHGDPTLRTALLGLRACADPPKENVER
jgi:formylglycine-generating enzyme required for sulfatase activity